MPVFAFVLAAALLEAGGDALLRKALAQASGAPHIALFLAGAGVLTAYGTVINLAPLEFGQLIGLYVAILFVMWQLINWAVFGAFSTLPILAGGALIVLGGLMVSFWKTA